MVKKIGKIQNLSHEKGYVEWQIGDFFSATERIFECESPVFFVADGDFFSATERIFECESPVFFVADGSWWFRLCFWDAKLIELSLLGIVEREHPANYHLGLKKYDGSIEQLGSGLMEGNKIFSNKGVFVNKTKLQMSKLVLNDVLSITCFIKLMTESRLDESKVNFKDSFNCEEVCHGILEVKDKKCKSQGSSFISSINYSAATLFQECLNYINRRVKELLLYSILNLYDMFDKYNMEKFKKFCVSYLMHCLTVENLCEIAVFANKNNEAQLFNTVQDYFNLNHVHIFLNPKWHSLIRTDIELVNKLLVEMAMKKRQKSSES